MEQVPCGFPSRLAGFGKNQFSGPAAGDLEYSQQAKALIEHDAVRSFFVEWAGRCTRKTTLHRIKPMVWGHPFQHWTACGCQTNLLQGPGKCLRSGQSSGDRWENHHFPSISLAEKLPGRLRSFNDHDGPQGRGRVLHSVISRPTADSAGLGTQQQNSSFPVDAEVAA